MPIFNTPTKRTTCANGSLKQSVAQTTRASVASRIHQARFRLLSTTTNALYHRVKGTCTPPFRHPSTDRQPAFLLPWTDNDDVRFHAFNTILHTLNAHLSSSSQPQRSRLRLSQRCPPPRLAPAAFTQPTEQQDNLGDSRAHGPTTTRSSLSSGEDRRKYGLHQQTVSHKDESTTPIRSTAWGFDANSAAI